MKGSNVLKIIKTLAVLLSASFILTGCGKDASAPSATNTDSDSSVSSDIVATEDNTIIITLHPEVAPLTCENFENLVSDGFYDGVVFHRIVDDFMAQGGDPDGTGMGGSSQTVKGEFSSNGVENNLSHQRGIVSMARSSDPDSASSQFFICYTDCSFLDGSYAAFGEVTEGMDVVDSFLSVPRSQNSMGETAVPETPVVMEKVTMIENDSDGNPRVQIFMNDFLK